MFSKTIYKQTLKSNYKLWLVFTIIMCVLSAVIIAVYDPQAMTNMVSMLESSSLGEMMGDQLGDMTTLLGMLGSNFYSMIGVILPLIYIIITANSLVASQVDRGSMAYTLSTPIKRSKVVATQALYLISSIFTMIVVVAIVGVTTTQISHGGVFGEAYTDDVKAVAEVLDVDEQEVKDNLSLILNNEDAIKEGAKTRDIDEDVYVPYIHLKMSDNAYLAAADVLDKEVEDVEDDPSVILDNDKALKAAADVMGQDEETYRLTLEATIAGKADTSQTEALQDSLTAGLMAAADTLNMEVSELSEDMSLLKENSAAMEAAVIASGVPEEMFTTIINQQLASKQVSIDEGVNFDIQQYAMLNLGLFLLLLAISSISFASSCIFNLSKHSLTFGAGIPIAFFIFQIMSQTGDSLEGFKYISLNTLFDPTMITSGGSYGVQFAVLAAIGVVLYIVGIEWFKKKDLPL